VEIRAITASWSNAVTHSLHDVVRTSSQTIVSIDIPVNVTVTSVSSARALCQKIFAGIINTPAIATFPTVADESRKKEPDPVTAGVVEGGCTNTKLEASRCLTIPSPETVEFKGASYTITGGIPS